MNGPYLVTSAVEVIPEGHAVFATGNAQEDFLFPGEHVVSPDGLFHLTREKKLKA